MRPLLFLIRAVGEMSVVDKERKYSRRYPELDRFASREEAKKSLNAWQKQLMKTPSFWLVLVGFTFGVGLTIAAILVSLRHWFLLPKSMFGAWLAESRAYPGRLS